MHENLIDAREWNFSLSFQEKIHKKAFYEIKKSYSRKNVASL